MDYLNIIERNIPRKKGGEDKDNNTEESLDKFIDNFIKYVNEKNTTTSGPVEIDFPESESESDENPVVISDTEDTY